MKFPSKSHAILVTEANAGNKQALETLIREIQDFIYNLSLKMLLFPEDAEDATQEILIKVITHLSTFRFESKFTTWVYKIAVNYLISHKGRHAREFAMPFENYAAVIDSGQSDYVSYAVNKGELDLLEEEVKVSCTQGLLLCLNETDRMVYILSDLLEFNSMEGAELLDITPQNFRKKLSRSRKKIRGFLHQKCGLVNPDNPCRCKRKIDFLINQKMFDPKNLRFAHLSRRSIEAVDQLEELERDVAIYNAVPGFPAPDYLIDRLRKAVRL